MEEINNLKRIREIYGATQEEIAQVADVNRSTVSQWENNASKASNTKLEKLSLYYGIGPEFFYEKELTKDAIELIAASASQEKEVIDQSNGERNKAHEFADMVSQISFNDVRSRFMFDMKLLLATADTAKLDDLITAEQIANKMLKRLEAIIKIREEEENDDDNKSLFELLESIT